VEQKNYTEIIEEAKRSKEYLLASPAKQEEHHQQQQQQQQNTPNAQSIQQTEQISIVSTPNVPATVQVVVNQSATAIEMEPIQAAEPI
jgi:hypothetical protein